MTEHGEDDVGSARSKDGESPEKRGFVALWKAATAQDSDDEDDAMDALDEETFGIDGSRNRAAVAESIVEEALRRATTAADRRRVLRDSRPAAVVVKVRSIRWIELVARYLKGLRRDWLVLARSGSDQRRHTANEGNDEVGQALSRGRSVIGIATDPERQLPRTLTAAADVRVELGGLDAAVVDRAMRDRFPAPAVPIPADALVALEIDDLVAAMRPGVGPEEAVELMRRASRRRSAGDDVTTAPDLARAVEFGAAREFGLALAQDMIDFREGRQSFSDSMKGGLLWGEPGVGKSILGASIAAAAGVPFLRFSIGSFFDRQSHLGTVIESLTQTMAKAASVGKCCLVMYEELEAIPRRDRLDDRGRSFWVPVIDTMLLLTDAGLSADEKNGGAGRPAGVFILGSTNYLDMVEPALLRANRFERAIEVTRPDAAGVANVLRYHLSGSLADEDLSSIARSLEGSTAAECMAVVRAAKRAARRADRPLRLADLATAAHGEDERSPQVAWRVAVHEAAHAVATVVTGEGGLVYVSIQGHGGRTRINPDREDLSTLGSIERTAVCLLAAGAAEAAIVGSLSAGWAGSDRSDLGLVSSMLAHLHASSGLTGNLFMRAGTRDAAIAVVRADPELGRAVEKHLRRLHGRAVALVGRHRDRIVAVAEALVERQHLDAAEVVAIVTDIPESEAFPQEDRR